MEPQLSAGCLQAALTTDFAGCPVVLQVLEVTRVTPRGDTGGGQSRVKLTVSDGVHKCTALLASQLKDLADSGQLQTGTIVEVRELVGNKQLQQTTSVGAKKCAGAAGGACRAPRAARAVAERGGRRARRRCLKRARAPAPAPRAAPHARAAGRAAAAAAHPCRAAPASTSAMQRPPAATPAPGPRRPPPHFYPSPSPTPGSSSS
jgi:hypothetical protein